MDRHALVLLIPIILLSIPVVAIIMNSLVKLARIRALGTEAEGAGELTGRLEALEQEVVGLRHELIDTQERLDFAERLLTRPDHAQLPRHLG